MNNHFAVYRSSIDRACQCRFPVESLVFPEKLFSPWWSYRIQWCNSTTLKMPGCLQEPTDRLTESAPNPTA